jgi:hypothetical protein
VLKRVVRAEHREKESGLVMRAILIFLIMVISLRSASAGNDRLLADRVEQFVRDERDRQDCIWRETLTRPRPESSEKLREIAGLVAYLCSENIRKQILQNITPATDLPHREGVAYDQVGAQERALLIGQQIRELYEKDRMRAP